MTSRDRQTFRVLHYLARGGASSQRAVSRDLGIALGLVNTILREMTDRRLVHVIRSPGRTGRLHYMLTPRGAEEEQARARRYFADALPTYAELRDRIVRHFGAVSSALGDGETPSKRVVFYGAGELSEIGYLCLRGSDLELVGVVDDDEPQQTLLGIPVQPTSELAGRAFGGRPFDGVLVMRFDRRDSIRSRLATLGVPTNRVFWM